MSSSWKPTVSIGDDELDQIEMEPENMSTAAREARISQEQTLAARAAAAAAIAGQGGGIARLLTVRNLLIAGVVIGGVVYLYKKRSS